MRLHDDEFPFLHRVQLLNGYLFVKNYFSLADEVNDNFSIWRQPEKIEVIQEDHIQLIVVPDFLVFTGVEVNNKSSH